MSLDVAELDGDALRETAGCLLKYRDDIDRLVQLGPERILVGDVAGEEAGSA